MVVYLRGGENPAFWICKKRKREKGEWGRSGPFKGETVVQKRARFF